MEIASTGPTTRQPSRLPSYKTLLMAHKVANVAPVSLRTAETSSRGHYLTPRSYESGQIYNATKYVQLTAISLVTSKTSSTLEVR